jgi:hypothetical protein
MTAKIVNSVIIGLVLVGTVFLSTLVQAANTGNLMPTLFLGFFAIIIAFQAVPALMLFYTMVKEIFRRHSAKAGEQVHSGKKG